MISSKDEKVQSFINKIMILNDTQYKILEKLRKIVFETYPEVKERMMYGGILFSLSEDFGGVFVYKNHVSFEFSNGYKFEDPQSMLEGSGKFRRHLKFQEFDEIEIKQAIFFIKQVNL
ncbi:DUF1801 domain-containing protein [Aquimarina sp. 2201CG5-10]|uniref:DUF1801 domain-containing protein n=1 Tax=Aquimarina callyspongiae TaxID=3098150 RepID=UPI002AB59EC0|nr:DUF1801 domain-containing protein [Aquimarina sp. 2201CG5-10]MDY8135661.1 DUF1801 domain-containing protein [Aquimarina sp. 2201CG5-10]